MLSDTMPAIGRAAIAQGPLRETIAEAVAAAEGELAAVRNDARESTPDVALGRAMTRNFLRNLARNSARNDAQIEAAITPVLGRVGRGLGYVSSATRVDASYMFPGEGIARDPGYIRPPEQPRRLVENLPTRNVPLDTWQVETRWAGYEGSAALYSPGDNSIPVSGGSVGATLRQMYAVVTSTFTPWDPAMRSMSGAVNRAEIDSEAARRVMLDFLEFALVGGIVGAGDWQGARQVPAATYPGQINWTTATMGQVFADFMAMAQAAPIANGDRGTGPTTVLMGTRALRALNAKNNLDAGGFGTGANVLGSFAQGVATRGQVMIEAGVDRVVGVPSLSGQGPNGANTAYDMAILYRPDQDGLRWISSMSPAPVRTVEELTGSRTLWAMVGAGLEAPNAVDVAIAYIPVGA